MDSLIYWITGLGLLAVAGVIFAESGLLIGFFLPGDSLLFATGLLAHQGFFGYISVHTIALTMFVAAAAGDNVGYAFGKRVGRRMFRRKESLLFQPENLHRAEAFYEARGPLTIILARFIPVMRTFAPIVAGIGKMRYRTFFMFNLIGALLWAVGITYLGYFIGAGLEAKGISIDRILLPAAIIIIVLSLLPPAYHLLKDPQQRRLIVKSLRRHR